MTEPQGSGGKAAIPLELVKTEIAFVKRMFTSPAMRRVGKGAPGYRRDVLYASMRQLLGSLSPAQVQFLSPTTDKVYNMVAKAKGAMPKTVELGENAKAHWIGDYSPKYVMLYLHGGAFYGSATAGHIRYMYSLTEDMRERGHDISVFALAYTLSPGGVYPLQLRQAASALRFLLEEGWDPSSILLAGDSAGGNLAAALLEHIAHPHPQIPTIHLSRPLHAAMLISPWVSFDTSWQTFQQNANSDYFTPPAVERAAITYIAPGSSHDAYSEPARSPPEWWADIAYGVVRNMMIWGGGGEVLLGGISDFANKVCAGFSRAAEVSGAEKQPPRFTFIVTPKHAHEEMIIDELTLGLAKGQGAADVVKWLSGVLS